MPGRPLIAIAVAVVLVSGCASSGDQTGTKAVHSPATGLVDQALSLWKDFPAASSPRPLVLTGPTVNDPATGFRNGGDKIAYLSGRFTLKTAVPGTSAAWEKHPLITAAQALADLRGSPTKGLSSAADLVVTDVRLGTSVFSTDRGSRRLPAWMLTFSHVRDPAAVLAIAPTDRWPKALPAGDDAHDVTATIAPGGHTVAITFVGAAAGTGPCTAQYEAAAAQSNSAVEIAIRQKPRASGHAGTCDLVGYQRVVTVSLTPALRGRVLIDSHGLPIPAR